jgi:para-nitrobenzyl esterase
VQVELARRWPRHFPLRPVVDGALLPRLPVETIADGSARGKRLLIGTNQDESAGFVGPHPEHDATAVDLGNMQPPQFLPVYEKYAKLYPELTVEQRRIRALTAEEYWVPSVRVAESHIEGGGEAWMYRFDFREGSGRLGAFASHSLELRFVWDHPLTTVANAASEAALARIMFDAWCAFLRGSAPNASGLPTWPRYSLDDRRTMIFNAASQVDVQPHQAELNLWSGLL